LTLGPIASKLQRVGPVGRPLGFSFPPRVLSAITSGEAGNFGLLLSFFKEHSPQKPPSGGVLVPVTAVPASFEDGTRISDAAQTKASRPEPARVRAARTAPCSRHTPRFGRFDAGSQVLSTVPWRGGERRQTSTINRSEAEFSRFRPDKLCLFGEVVNDLREGPESAILNHRGARGMGKQGRIYRPERRVFAITGAKIRDGDTARGISSE